MSLVGAEVLNVFKTNRESVRELVNLDRTLVQLFLTGLREMAAELREKNLYAATRRIENRVSALENVQRHDSLRRYYQTMLNQCVVLLVSYFGSAVHDVFRRSVAHAFTSGADVGAVAQEIKICWRDINSAGGPLSETFADVIIAQRDISFQDMQSIARAFESFFGIHIQRTSDVNDLVLAQAARHAIVHSAGLIDQRMMRQLTSAKPRSLKLELTVGEAIQFTSQEIEFVGGAMERYLERLIGQIAAQLPGSPDPAA